MEYYFDPALVMTDNNDSVSNFETPFKKSQSTRNLGKNGDDEVLYSSKHLYVPCTIIKRLEDDNNNNAGNGKTNNTEPYDGPTLVKTVDGTLHKIYDSSKLQALSAPDDYVGMDDILHLPHVTEASLLHTLRTRYKMDDIYTSAGPILISINPYRTVTLPDGQSLYSEELMMKYRATGDISGEKPPHLFQVADRAYVAMMDSVHPSMDYKHMDDEDVDLLTEHHVPSGKARNQSIIISGESGAVSHTFGCEIACADVLLAQVFYHLVSVSHLHRFLHRQTGKNGGYKVYHEVPRTHHQENERQHQQYHDEPRRKNDRCSRGPCVIVQPPPRDIRKCPNPSKR